MTCPWHGYEFDVHTGASVGGASKGKLGSFGVEVRGESVMVSSRRSRPQRKRPAQP